MAKLSATKITAFQNLIFKWFQKNQRDLPWRHTHDPYAVLVSEVMLQQTQVDRILKYWPAWLERWPTFESLAAAPASDVIRAWAGLGYNRRAVNLHRAARFIVDQGGFYRFQTITDLQAIPGIRPATAGALANFVWNRDTAFLEVNIKRILQRLALGPETRVGWARDKELLAIAEAVLPQGKARLWPHALMDFGALACRADKPECLGCPLKPLTPAVKGRGLTQRHTLKRPPFIETNRYWRGRIIDTLRQKSPLSQKMLFEKLPTQPKKLEHARFMMLLKALEQDGLVTISKSQVQLPA